eukprot:c34970_g1_i1.p1 GENE.c34970_g1_i1~~c34970_g1_i1.p1  ORF type:complete len:445 (+),score=57.74 c34970_g1_i1:54-1337(+)
MDSKSRSMPHVLPPNIDDSDDETLSRPVQVENPKMPTRNSLGTMWQAAGRRISWLPRRISAFNPHHVPDIHTLMTAASNKVCADCSATAPKWGVVTHGCFVCTECAGVHRSLGTHISFVLSCTLDKWTPEQTAAMYRGNEEANSILEFYVAGTVEKPNANSDRSVRQDYITAKYRDKAFTQAHAPLSTSGLPTRRPPRPARAAAASVAGPRSQAMVLYEGMIKVILGEAVYLDLAHRSSQSVFCKVAIGGQTVRSRLIPTHEGTKGESEKKSRTSVRGSLRGSVRWKKGKKDEAPSGAGASIGGIAWDETLLVCCTHGEPLHVGVWSKVANVRGRDFHVGSVVLDVSGLVPDEDNLRWVPLHSRHEISSAPISLSALSSSPPPPTTLTSTRSAANLKQKRLIPKLFKKRDRARGWIQVTITKLSLSA